MSWIQETFQKIIALSKLIAAGERVFAIHAKNGPATRHFRSASPLWALALVIKYAARMTPQPTPSAGLKSWTVLVYIAADVPERDMREAALNSLEKMRGVGSGEDFDVAAQIDVTDKPTQRFWFPPNPDRKESSLGSCLKETLRNVDSGSKEALLDFLNWGIKNYPARKYMFVLWGHGYGLDDYDPFPKYLLEILKPHTEIYPTAPLRDDSNGPTAAFALDEQRSLEPNLERYWALIASVMPDFSSKTLLLNRDIGLALRAVQASLPGGQRIEIIGLDACNMAMAEVWYEMAGGASIAIGSEYAVPYASWPCDLILQHLSQNQRATPAELAKASVDCYAEYYSLSRTRERVTLSACAMTEVDRLTERIKALVAVLLPKIGQLAFARTIFHARNRTLEFETAGFIDLSNFCEWLEADVAEPEVAAAAQGVIESISQFVLANQTAPYNSKMSRAKGLAIYFPRWIENPDRRSSIQRRAMEYLSGPYRESEFAKKTRWSEFLLGLLHHEQ